MNSWPIAVSYGGGDNSRALMIEMVRRGIRPDLVIFSDTKGERPKTYLANAEFSAWLVSKGFPPITIVSEERQSLEEECLTANTLPSLAFGFRSCSDKYKIRPQNRFLKTWKPALDAWAAGGKVIKFIGYDAGEPHRLGDFTDARFHVEFPLVAWGWDRAKCSAVVREAGFMPAKSACFYCPAHKKGEVIALAKDEPELFARAVAMERNATAATTVKGLGRHWSWEALVAADAAQMDLFPDLPNRVPCGCYDGA